MNVNESGCKLELEYPCEWQYKAIGMNKEKLMVAIEAIFAGLQCQVTYSNSSKTGKYHSYSIDLNVESEEERVGLFNALKDDPQVKMVI